MNSAVVENLQIEDNRASIIRKKDLAPEWVNANFYVYRSIAWIQNIISISQRCMTEYLGWKANQIIAKIFLQVWSNNPTLTMA